MVKNFIPRIPSLGVVFLGLVDMSGAFSPPGGIKHPEIANFVRWSASPVSKVGKAVGLRVSRTQGFRDASALGANLLTCRVDAHVLMAAVGVAVAGVAALRESH